LVKLSIGLSFVLLNSKTTRIWKIIEKKMANL
jgi:hypothetical protein